MPFFQILKTSVSSHQPMISPKLETGPLILIGHFFSRFWARRRFNWTSVRRPSAQRPCPSFLLSSVRRASGIGREGEPALIGPKRHSAFNEMSDAKLESGKEGERGKRVSERPNGWAQKNNRARRDCPAYGPSFREPCPTEHSGRNTYLDRNRTPGTWRFQQNNL